MNEVWKDVVGYEGLYEVSDLGNVRSLNWGKRGFAKNLYLKPHQHGYLQVELFKNGTRKMFMVHRLVAIAFIPNDNDLPLINHKDEDKKNNHVDNLEWCNNRYNVCYSLERHERIMPKTRNGKRKAYRVIQCDLDGNPIQEWENAREVYRETGMSDCSVTSCCIGKRKTAYGFKWRYAN